MNVYYSAAGNFLSKAYFSQSELGAAHPQLVVIIIVVAVYIYFKSYMSVLQATVVVIVVVAAVNVIVVFIDIVADHVVFNCGQ